MMDQDACHAAQGTERHELSVSCPSDVHKDCICFHQLSLVHTSVQASIRGNITYSRWDGYQKLFAWQGAGFVNLCDEIQIDMRGQVSLGSTSEICEEFTANNQ